MTAPEDPNGLREALARAEAERDAAREERDALLRAAGFKPGPFRTDLSRKVITEDIAGMRPAMVKARRAAERVQSDADLWTMRMLEEWPGDTLLIRLWRQRRETAASLLAAEAENTRLKEGMEAAAKRQSKIDFFGLALHSLDAGAPGMKPVVRDAIARNIALRIRSALSPKEQS